MTTHGDERSTARGANTALWLLVVLASLWTAYFLRPVLVALVFAVLLKFLLSPAVRWARRRGVPTAATSIVLIGGAIGTGGGAVMLLAPAAMHWTDELPDRLQRLEDKLVAVTTPVAALSEVTSKVGEKVDDLAEATKGETNETEPTVVRIEERSWLASALAVTQQALFEIGLMLALLFLLLLNDGLVLSKIEARGDQTARRWLRALGEIEKRTSTYVASMLLIYAIVGACTAALCAASGLPNPLLWGLLAAVGEGIPFVGPIAVGGVLLVVGLTTFDTVGQGLVAPLGYIAINMLVGNVLAPCLLGRWLSLSPVAILIALTLMGFLWGIPGLVLAVPLLVIVRIVSDHVPSWRFLQILLDGRARRPTTMAPAAPTVREA